MSVISGSPNALVIFEALETRTRFSIINSIGSHFFFRPPSVGRFSSRGFEKKPNPRLCMLQKAAER
jgi:hypothetical protein